MSWSPFPPPPPPPPKRKVFISYCALDEIAVDAFVNLWCKQLGVFTPKIIGGGTTYAQDVIDSTSTEYVMNRLRTEYLADSTVTLLLLGDCTHTRRYVDWELKASLRQGDIYVPNGLFGVLLPGHSAVRLPHRFEANWRPNATLYARYYSAPATAGQLRAWIEDAYQARTTRAHLINNSTERLLYNRHCNLHGITH